jgi:ribosomal protein S18 acetylase RimI-like enzyme
VIRRARAQDGPALARFHTAAWNDAYRGLVPDETIDAWTPDRRERQWSAWLASDEHVALVAERQDELLGLALAGWNENPAFTHRAKLVALYVRNDCQGSGIGRALVAAAAKHLTARGYAKMSLYVLHSNPARGFYERLGGIHLGDREVEIDGQRWFDSEYEVDVNAAAADPSLRR